MLQESSARSPFAARFVSMPEITNRLISFVPSKMRLTARVTIVPLGGIVANIAVGAMDLHVLVEHEIERLAAEHFRDRRLDRELLERRGQRQVAAVACSPV